MSATDPAASAEERKKKSLYYESCTSAYKDDFATLVKCLRGDVDSPHTRQEAGFLLWHHALEGNAVTGLCAAGLLGSCVANLFSGESQPPDKACSAGILLALAADNQEVAEQVVRARAPTGETSLQVLHGLLTEDAAMARHHCCRLLHLLAKQVPQLMLRSMENHLPYLPAYLAVWGVRDQREAPAISAVACVVSLLVQEQPDLAALVVDAGGVVSLLDVLRAHKSEAACSAAAACLAKLLSVEGAAEQLIAEGGIPLLVDVMGPPPRAALENLPDNTDDEEGEGEEEEEAPEPPAEAAPPRTPDPNSGENKDAADEGGREAPRPSTAGGAAADAAETSAGSPRRGSGPLRSRASSDSVCSSPAGSPSGGLRSRPTAIDSGTASESSRSLGSHGGASLHVRVALPLVIPGIHSPSAAAMSGAASPHSRGGPSSSRPDMAAASPRGRATQSASSAPPPLRPPSAANLGANRSALRWIMMPGLDVASMAAACLTTVMHRPECLTEAERRLVSHRTIAQLRAAMPPAKSGGTGKKSKKKGLGLTPELVAGLTRVLGLLKFLSLTNTTRYRIAKLDAVPMLVLLYNEGSCFLLRNHCQAILSNVALLAENGQALQDAKTPEEFLVGNPMKLTAQERAVLRFEFPGEPALAR